MANPQVKDGHVKLANDIFEALYAYDFNKRDLRVLLAIIRATYGWQKKAAKINATDLGKALGMARQNVAATIQALKNANILECKREPGPNTPGVYGLQKDWEKWNLVLLGETPKARRSNTRAHQKNDALPHQNDQSEDSLPHQNSNAVAHQKNDAVAHRQGCGVPHQNAEKFDAVDPPSNADGEGIVGAPKDKERHVKTKRKTESAHGCDDFFQENAHLFDSSKPQDLFSAAVQILQQVVPGWEPLAEEKSQVQAILRAPGSAELKLEAFKRALDVGRDTREWAMGRGKSPTFIAGHMLRAIPAILGELLDAGRPKKPKPPKDDTPPYHLNYFN